MRGISPVPGLPAPQPGGGGARAVRRQLRGFLGRSVELVLQLVQDADHDLPQGLRLAVLLDPVEDAG